MTPDSIAIIEDNHQPDTESFEFALTTLGDEVHTAVISYIQGLTAAHEKELAQNRRAINDLEKRNGELEHKVEHEAQVNENLAGEVRGKEMLVGKLQEKVIDQGRVVSELCKEVDRLHKKNDSLSVKSNLVGRLQEKVVEQGRMVSELCKEVDKLSRENETLQLTTPALPRLVPTTSPGTMDDSVIGNKNNSPLRALIPNIEHCPVGSRQQVPSESPNLSTRASPPAIANIDTRRQRRRVSMPGGGSYASEERTIHPSMRRSNHRRLSTGAAACA
uniref:Uncharacterized protein n=1 Tax=Helicotheca tamesis TaxID=374047 RepID=A0A7S2H1Z3_9STRA|mmetsp:Transcript_14504/g.19840  ORF Transcript_14504/g.19840 Transcript_14504/m.19840 type:complete len:275 (+) Transcript_14504:246-1070(+)